MLKKLIVSAALAGLCGTAAAADPLLDTRAIGASYRMDFGGAQQQALAHSVALRNSATTLNAGNAIMEYRWQGTQSQFDVGGVPFSVNGERVSTQLGQSTGFLGLTGIELTAALIAATITAAVIVEASDNDDNNDQTGGSGGSN
ncbi:hypothetical protein JN531_016540 [Flagellatimonas centrodinii]|uniref:hypothetical protein n=1 Tax=Flagellatimonas centrodinii TaxID=2806210 RepID=UPI001FFC30F3|nr:hypothetical protein [Flagellatimonas centrodinii]ULQ46690.1 hypothetical protein JN531_016540 [Flagellatimonas centrodinii]